MATNLVVTRIETDEQGMMTVTVAQRSDGLSPPGPDPAVPLFAIEPGDRVLLTPAWMDTWKDPPRPSLWRRLLARLGLVAVVLLLACATARVPRIYSRDGATDRDFFDEKRDCVNYVDEACGRRNPCGPRFSDAFSFACDVYKSCMERNFDECMSVKGWTWIEPQRTAASVPPPGGHP